ncbi:MAG: hypothetical protein K6G11_03130 [Lachnospiraceae bacterium]|nr:hypothetical protein [Lachnospiraceae bacterium]
MNDKGNLSEATDVVSDEKLLNKANVVSDGTLLNKSVVSDEEIFSEAIVVVSDEVIPLTRDRFLSCTEQTVSVLNENHEIIFRDKPDNFVLLWNKIEKKNGETHVSIIIDYRTLPINEHFQVAAFEGDFEEDVFNRIVDFSKNYCSKFEDRLQKNFWKAIRYEMPEKPTSKRTTYKTWCMKARLHHFNGSKNKL